jgi:Protein of unknown function (DUF1826)
MDQPARQAARIVEGKRAAVLDRISSNDVALAIWTRQLAGSIAAWLDALPSERLPDGQFVATPAEVPNRLAILCELVGLADSPERAFLIADIAALAARFARLSGSLRVDVRLEAVDHDSCWRFHRDHVGLRLNATYRGPGTQWPPLDQASRAARAQRRYRGALNELPRFSVGLFKGVHRAGQLAVLHRSPPVEGSGVARLFLCINEDTISL